MAENVFHSPEFFDQMRGCRDAYRLLADCYHDALFGAAPSAFRSVVSGRPLAVGSAERGPITAIDVGCGTGAQTARLAELGWSIVGVDVFDTRPEPGFAFRNLDVLETPATLRYDVVVCTETAEHIAEARADDLVRAVASRAEKHILWSAAGPGQEWEGHVNLQEPDYWFKKFFAHGWIPNFVKSDELAKMMRDRRAQHWMAAHKFFVLERLPAKILEAQLSGGSASP